MLARAPASLTATHIAETGLYTENLVASTLIETSAKRVWRMRDFLQLA